LINVHAPTKMEEIKEFYNLLKQYINQIANSDIKITLVHSWWRKHIHTHHWQWKFT